MSLTFIAPYANSADDKLVIVLLYFPENGIWHFMQIVPILPECLSVNKLVWASAPCTVLYPVIRILFWTQGGEDQEFW